MGGADLDDNPSSYYRLDIGVRNRKWWWFILFWSVGVVLPNAYIIYIYIHNMHVTPKKHSLSHHGL